MSVAAPEPGGLICPGLSFDNNWAIWCTGPLKPTSIYCVYELGLGSTRVWVQNKGCLLLEMPETSSFTLVMFFKGGGHDDLLLIFTESPVRLSPLQASVRQSRLMASYTAALLVTVLLYSHSFYSTNSHFCIGRRLHPLLTQPAFPDAIPRQWHNQNVLPSTRTAERRGRKMPEIQK